MKMIEFDLKEYNKLYNEDMLPHREVAKKMGYTYIQLRYRLKQYGIKGRTKSESKALAYSLGRQSPMEGVNNPNYKHGKSGRFGKYGIDEDFYTIMLVRSKGRCELCNKEFKKTPNIDHCHETDIVRGLLCSPCNRGLGFFRDNATTLLKASKWVSK